MNSDVAGGDLATAGPASPVRLKLDHMQLHARVSRSLIELVKRFEGLRRGAARLPDGGWTIGYGHTRSAREGVVVSPDDAEALLYYDLSEVATKVDAWTFTPLNQNQFEALTAFAFNIGLENFRRSTVLRQVNEGQHLRAAATLELWRKAEFGGEDVVIDALVRRRAAEKAHYLTPPEGFSPSPTPVIRPMFDRSVIEAAVAGVGGPAAVIEASLEGREANLHMEDAPAPGAGDAPFPSAAASGAARSDPLHQSLPEISEITPLSAADPFVQVETVNPRIEEPAPAILRTEPSAEMKSAPSSNNTPASYPGEIDEGHRREAAPFDRLGPENQASSRASSRKIADRSLVYLSIGLLGVALFIAALFSMLGGKATPVNLVVGLAGIFLMTPAGGYFLLSFLNRGEPTPEA